MANNATTNIATTKTIKDRLESNEQKRENNSDILEHLMDKVNTEELMDRMYRRLEEKDKFIPIDEIGN